MNSHLQNILNSIQLLVTTVEGKKECRSTRRNAFCTRLESKINELLEFLQSIEKLKYLLDDVPQNIEPIPDEVLRWYFVEWILKLMNLLSAELKAISGANKTLASQASICDKVPCANLDAAAPSLSVNALSLSQTKTVGAALEFIFVFGIGPSLQQGVGIPMKHRSELVALMNEARSSDKSIQNDNSHLRYCVESLLSYLQEPDLADILLSRHVGDFLAALLQLVFGKKVEVATTGNNERQCVHHKCSAEYSRSQNYGSEEQTLTVNGHHGYGKILDNFVENVPLDVLVRELLIIQGGGSQQQGLKGASLPPARSPLWLKKACRLLIWRTVSKSDGVLAVFSGILQSEDEGNSRKCDAAARIVHDCYQGFCSMEQHYSRVALQVVRIVTEASKGPYLRAAVGITALMASGQLKLAEKCVLKPLLLPLYMCLDEEFNVADVLKETRRNTEQVDEDELSSCIEVIHRAFVLNCEPLSPIIACLKPLVDVVFDLYKFTRQSVSHLRDPLSDIMQRLLASQDVPTTVTYLHQLTFGGLASFKRTSKQLRFVNGEKGGVKAIRVSNVTETDDEEWTTAADAVVELIVSLQQQQVNLVAEFFLWCLEELTKLISSEMDIEHSFDAPSTPVGECGRLSLLEIDDRIARAENTLKRNLLLLGTISALCERLEHQCLQNTTHIIKFVRVTLERTMKILTSEDEAVFSAIESETLLMAMGLLTTIMTDEELCKKMSWEDADCLLPFLKYFAESYSDVTVQQIAFNLQVAVATRGRVDISDSDAVKRESIGSANANHFAVKGETCGKSSSVSVNANSKPPSRSLIEVIDVDEKPESRPFAKEKEPSNREPSGSSTLSKVESTVSSAGVNFHDAMELIKDPLIPVQGHALICLRRLVDNGDKDTLDSRDILFNLSLTQITHSDSYIFLSAVQLLAATVIRFPNVLLPRLIEEYLRSSSNDTTHAELSSECRMKLGEVLVKTSAALGPLVPHYKDVLIGSCLRAARDCDPLIRASAMSNLGQVCQHLHFSLGSVMFEVFECVQALIKFDSIVEVRRSAAVCATLLLRGLAKDALKVLGGDLMQNFYRMLKHVSTVEKDDVVRLHVQLAREEIDTFMKDFAFPQQNLIKRIHVIDPPDVD